MKNIVGIAFLIFLTAQRCTAQDWWPLINMVKNIGIAYVGGYTQDFFNDNCPGICLPQPVSFLCQIVYANAGCPSSRRCCVYDMRIDINTPNRTVFYPDNGYIPEDTTISVKDKETSHDDNITITTNLPSTTYETNVSEFEEEENSKIKEKNNVQDKDNISCSGVCVEHHLTNTCEAYFNSTDLCRSGKRCCVNISSYVGSQPSDLVVLSETVRPTEQSLTTTTATNVTTS